LEAEQQDSGGATLHERLRQIDPLTAARLPAADTRRIFRALEIHHVTGRPASELQQQAPLPENERPPHVYWLHPPRDWLRERIDRRVEQMFAAGLVEEVERLVSTPSGMGRTARQALGYKEVLDHLAGNCTRAEAIETLQRRTRQFAKRQHTWFRNLVECDEVRITGGESAEQVAELVLARSLSLEDR
jgi:tRNA dimethylallyltransferase